MATKAQKEQLIDTLKFTPREVSIRIWGYGGEIVMGRVNREAYRWWSTEAEKAGVDLDDFVFNWSWEEENPNRTVPAEARFITPGEWHECDNISHESGAEVSDSSGITVTYVDTGEEIFECSLSRENMETHGIEISCHLAENQEDAGQGNACFIGQSVEKGMFFDGRITITRPFDPSRLRLTYNSVADWDLISGVEYDGEDIEGIDGYDTRGKSMDCQLIYIGTDPGTDPYDEHTEWPDSWLSKWHDVATEPEHDGVYEVEVGEWQFRKVWWINEAWRDDHGVPVQGVSRWRGLDREIT